MALATRAAIALLILSTATGHAGAQTADPKRSFTEALGRFSAALDGRHGDDGTRVAANLAALEDAIARWDRAIANADAATAAETAVVAGPAAVRLRVGMALSLAERGRVDDALARLTDTIAIAPTDVDAHTVLGLIHSQLTGNVTAAGSAFRVAVAADPGAPLQRYLLAKHLADHGTAEEAAAVGRPLRADTHGPDAPDRAPFVRLHLIPEVAGIEPFYPHARYAPAFVRLARGDYRGAVDAFRAAVASDPIVSPPPGTAEGLARAGATFRDGDVDGALAALDAVVKAAPDWGTAYRLRGLVLIAGDRMADGLVALRDAIRLDPSDERAHLAFADALLQEDRFEDADQALGAAVAELPQSPRLRHAHARVLQRQGQYPEALAGFESSLSLQPGLPLLGMNSVYGTVATLRRTRQEFAEATAAFSRRVGLIPNDVGAHRDLGDIYFRQGLDDLAWTEFAMASALAPRDVATHAALAQLHLRAGRHAEAIAAARQTVALDAAHVQARYVLGTALTRAAQADEGMRELETYARLEAEEARRRKLDLELSALRREAVLSAGQGDHAKAVALLSQVVEKDTKSPTAHLELGEALLEAGRPQEAVERLQAAAGLGASFVVYRHLADAYAALGQAAESQRAREVHARVTRDNLRRQGSQ